MSEIYKFKLKMRRMLENRKYWAEKIAEAAQKVLGKCEVYVFGSIVEGKWTGGSDVDILIITDRKFKNSRERAEIKTQIEEKAELPSIHPFEIHIVTRKEAEWYWKHIKKSVKIR